MSYISAFQGNYIDNQIGKNLATISDINNIQIQINNMINAIYPVGSLYLSMHEVNPSTLFGGAWTKLTNGFLWAAVEGQASGERGGAWNHNHTTGDCTLTESQIPSHRHNVVWSQSTPMTLTYGAGSIDVLNIESWAWAKASGGSNIYAYNTGGDQPHNHGITGEASHCPPYISVNVWQRTA